LRLAIYQAPFDQPYKTVTDFNASNSAIIKTTASGIKIGGFHFIERLIYEIVFAFATRDFCFNFPHSIRIIEGARFFKSLVKSFEMGEGIKNWLMCMAGDEQNIFLGRTPVVHIHIMECF